MLRLFYILSNYLQFVQETDGVIIYDVFINIVSAVGGLFMSTNRLSPQQKKRRKKRIAITCAILVAVLVVITILLVMLQRSITEKYKEEEQQEILTAIVTTGSIRTTVSGSGTLSNEESVEVMLPANVLLDQVVVNRQESVEAGDLLATVNNETVIAAMAELQTELDELDADLTTAESDAVDSSVIAAVSGRVKAIFAELDEDVSAVMYEDSALILMSLDGYMTVEINLSEPEENQASREHQNRKEVDSAKEEESEETTTEAPDLVVGDSVTVTGSDGTAYAGTVDRLSANGELITVLVADNGPVYGDEVIVSVDEVEIGTGILDIHEPLAITGYAGTVATIEINVDEWIYAGDTLLTLTNTGYTANYESLLKARLALEEELQTLIAIYQEGGIYAPESGKIDSVSYNERSATSSNTETVIMTIRPSDSIIVTVYVDESDILNLSVGQDATVSISSIEDETFRAEVTEISSEGTSSGGVTQYAVTLIMDKTTDMRSGMSATAAISISGAENALLLLEDAVQQSRDTYYVYTALDEESGDLSGAASVEIGISGNGNVEIISGLKEGDMVYYTPEEEVFSTRSFGSSSTEMRGGR